MIRKTFANVHCRYFLQIILILMWMNPQILKSTCLPACLPAMIPLPAVVAISIIVTNLVHSQVGILSQEDHTQEDWIWENKDIPEIEGWGGGRDTLLGQAPYLLCSLLGLAWTDRQVVDSCPYSVEEQQRDFRGLEGFLLSFSSLSVFVCFFGCSFVFLLYFTSLSLTV